MPKLVLDASLVISWCIELNDPVIFDNLREAGFEFLIPERVVDEVETRNPVSEHIFRNSEIVECESDRHKEVSNRFFRLGSGEIAVLAVGEELENMDEEYFCVLDDRLARRACDRLDLEYSGSIGLLGELVNRNQFEFDRADELIQEMKDSGTHLPDNHTELLQDLT